MALAAVIRAEPDFESVPSGTPAAIHRVLRRCLTKDVRARLAEIADARLELLDASSSSDDRTPATVRLAFWQRPAWLIAMAAALVIRTAIAVRNRPLPPLSGGALARYVVSLPEACKRWERHCGPMVSFKKRATESNARPTD